MERMIMLKALMTQLQDINDKFSAKKNFNSGNSTTKTHFKKLE